MQTIWQLLTRRDLTPGDLIDEILRSGCHLFGEALGIVSRIDGDTYTVEHVYAPGFDIAAGQEFTLAETYCAITLGQQGGVAINHMASSEWSSHPCYRAFELESYIGVPIEVDGRVYGTLNFSSPHPVVAAFREIDLEFIGTLGSLVGGMIEKEMAVKDLTARATRDPLAGVANRHLFEARAAQCAEIAAAGGPSYSLLYLDLDGFKDINDGYGHAVGDELLRLVAKRLQSIVRQRDLLARTGGDEFVVLMDGACRTTAEKTAKRIPDVFAQPFVIDGRRLHLDISVGIACSEDHGDVAALVDAADRAMYLAKTGVRRPGQPVPPTR